MRILVFLVGAFILCFVEAEEKIGIPWCPVNYIGDEKSIKCYGFQEGAPVKTVSFGEGPGATWVAAQESCIKQGGLLAIIDHEAQAPLKFLRKKAIEWGILDAWIAANDETKLNTFEWLDGTPLVPKGILKYFSKFPDDHEKPGCIMLQFNTKEEEVWIRNAPCGHPKILKNFICQMPMYLGAEESKGSTKYSDAYPSVPTTTAKNHPATTATTKHTTTTSTTKKHHPTTTAETAKTKKQHPVTTTEAPQKPRRSNKEGKIILTPLPVQKVKKNRFFRRKPDDEDESGDEKVPRRNVVKSRSYPASAIAGLIPSNTPGAAKIVPASAEKLVHARSAMIVSMYGSPTISDEEMAELIPPELTSANISDAAIASAKQILTEMSGDYFQHFRRNNATEIAKALTSHMLEEGRSIRCTYGVNEKQRQVECIGKNGIIDQCIKVMTTAGSIVRDCGLPGIKLPGCHTTIGGVVCFCEHDLCNRSLRSSLVSSVGVLVATFCGFLLRNFFP